MENKKKGCGCSSIFIILLLIGVAIFVVALISSSDSGDSGLEISNTGYMDETVDTSEEDVDDPQEIDDPTTAEETQASTESEYEGDSNIMRGKLYEFLSDEEKEVYDVLAMHIGNGELVFSHTYSGNTDPNETLNATYAAFDALYADRPDFFWLNHMWGADGMVDPDGTFTIDYEIGCYEYWTYTTDRQGYYDDTIAAAEKIAKEANKLSSEYEKVKYVHDYFVNNITYDNVCLEEINATKQKASSQQSHTAYGALVNDLAVCDGYSKGFQLVMNMLGIECIYNDGFAGEFNEASNVGHAWNIICIDDEYYWLDVTWGDMDLKECPDGVNYTYFNVTSEEYLKDHDPDEKWPFLPDCTSTENSYFENEDAYFEKYDFEDVSDFIVEHKEDQVINIKFSSAAELKKAKDELFEKDAKIKERGDEIDANLSYASIDDYNVLLVMIY